MHISSISFRAISTAIFHTYIKTSKHYNCKWAKNDKNSYIQMYEAFQYHWIYKNNKSCFLNMFSQILEIHLKKNYA